MELFKLLGTIAIENADAKKALKEVSQEGEKTESKLGKFFGGIGKGAAVAGKAIATGLAAGATACVGLATAAIKSYADYEQLVGGSQLLFGDAFGYVEEQAKNAYKTVQMSTNDYLQQVNGFSTGLKTALGGNEQAAAELAHKIVVAEADIIAATGNTAENVQNAFNGIMKSNFTMLDNLQLGITPTKEGFQEVIDKVNEWNKANGEATSYQIDNLADCQSALVDYIEMQGLAEYASNEAAATIQGSWGMLKGAWSNLLVGFSDPSADLQSLINNVFESVNTFAGNLIPRITQVFQGIATSFTQLVPMLTAEIPNLLNQVLPALVEGAVALVDGLVSVLPSVIDAILAVLPMLIDGCMMLVDGLIGALPQIIQALVAALPTLIPQLIDAVVGMIMMLVEMLPQIIQPIIDALPTIIVAIVDALISNLPVLIQGCVQLIVALAAALPQICVALWEAVKGIFVLLGQKIMGFFEPVKTAISNAWNAMAKVPGLSNLKTMIEQVWGAIKTHITTVVNAIKNVVTTGWNNIKNVISTVLNAIKNVISTAWNAIKTVVTNVMKLIASVLKGDWEGVKSAISNILNAIKSVIQSIWNGILSVISSVLNAIKSNVSAIWEGIKSVVTSVLNTIKSVIESVWNGIKGTITSVLNGIKSTVTSAWNNIKSVISNAINNLKSTVSNGFNNIKSTIINTLKAVPGQVASVGMDIVRGIGNGITSGVGWIKGVITSFVGNVKSFIKNLFGIRSPSTWGRDDVGRQLAAGIGIGIEENEKAAIDAMRELGKGVMKQAKENLKNEEKAEEKLNAEILKVAKDRLAQQKKNHKISAAAEAAYWEEIKKIVAEGTEELAEIEELHKEARANIAQDQKSVDEDVLSTAQKRLDDYKVYNALTLADEVGFWDEISKQIKEGTDARIEADKKYLEAKKSLDEQIAASARTMYDAIATAEEKLASRLEANDKRLTDRAKDFASKFGLFDVASVDQTDGDQMFYALHSQVEALEQYQEEISKLEGRIGDTELFKELQEMGVDALLQIRELNSLSDYSLNYYLDMYKKRNELAYDIAYSELHLEHASEEAAAYAEFADAEQLAMANHIEAMKELGVELTADTEAMKTSTVNTFRQMLDTISKAFEEWKPDIKLPHFKLEGDFDLNAGTVPTIGVEWYKKAMNNAMLLDKPTIFGFNNANGKFLGAGDAGSEVVAGSTTLMNMIQNAVAEQNGTLTYYLQKIVELLATFFPEQIESFKNMKLQLNTGALVGELVEPMDEALGILSRRKDRGI